MKQSDERVWGMLCHLTAFVSILGPLIIWLLKKDESQFVDEQGRESLNFQISLLIYYFISGLLMLVLIGFLLVFVVMIFHFVLIIIASVRTYNGENYRYPLTIRFF